MKRVRDIDPHLNKLLSNSDISCELNTLITSFYKKWVIGYLPYVFLELIIFGLGFAIKDAFTLFITDLLMWMVIISRIGNSLRNKGIAYIDQRIVEHYKDLTDTLRALYPGNRKLYKYLLLKVDDRLQQKKENNRSFKHSVDTAIGIAGIGLLFQVPRNLISDYVRSHNYQPIVWLVSSLLGLLMFLVPMIESWLNDLRGVTSLQLLKEGLEQLVN